MSASTQRLHVELPERGYDIVIGSGILPRAHEFLAPVLAGTRAIIVTDRQAGEHYATPLNQALTAKGVQVEELWIAPGEGSKSFASYEMLMEQLLALTPDRKTTLIALGGGVVGDLTGFAASTLLRGVPFIQVPTTLLAQVDSSVGGKTAINARAGKNLVGSFYQPLLVLADLDTLKTLPARAMRCGYAEIIKYGLIMDKPFYGWCLKNGAALLKGDVALLQKAVADSCAFKAKIVSADEREGDTRAWLNFGHTFAHALEAETHYGDKLQHGEAVAIGMAMGCKLSAEMKLLDPAVEKELALHLRALGMPATLKDIAHDWDASRIASHFLSDKKAEGGTLTFVVLDGVGKAKVVKNVDAALAQSVVSASLKG